MARRAGQIAAATLALGLTSGCIDFGYQFERNFLVDDGGAGGGGSGGGGGSCVEGPVSPPADAVKISIVTLNLDRPLLAVDPGQVVAWLNTDTMRHDVTSGTPEAVIPLAQGGFRSGVLAPGATWAFRFCKARSIVYFCSEHPKQMFGYKIIVR